MIKLKQILRDKYRGALLGLAAGDALGTTLEFKPPGTFYPIADMIGGGPFLLRYRPHRQRSAFEVPRDWRALRWLY
jgi:hypothetical protein